MKSKKYQVSSGQNCRIGAKYMVVEAMIGVSQDIENLRVSKPLTDCGKEGLCDERSHGSHFWCGICCKQG